MKEFIRKQCGIKSILKDNTILVDHKTNITIKAIAFFEYLNGFGVRQKCCDLCHYHIDAFHGFCELKKRITLYSEICDQYKQKIIEKEKEE